MRRIRVNASHAYDIIIGENILYKLGSFCREVMDGGKICVVTDTNVEPLYFDAASASLRLEGFDVLKFVIPAGEASKSTTYLVELLEFMAENHLTRSDCALALGGGVVGDLCGFASAVYLRGIKFIGVPTTLLAAVDSSVGGKTAVDLAAGKNLAGAFHQPSLVVCDYKALDTLSPEIFADGCAEIIKYGVINDRALFDKLKNGIKNDIEEIIALCVQNKASIVETDEFDLGKRQLLNLGHTVGHAIELCSDFKISHGSAVAIGMVIVMRSAVNQGICPTEALDELIWLLKKENLPTSCEFTATELAAAALGDKKRAGDNITLVVPFSIGDSRLVRTPVDALEKFIEGGL
jgi:3-dehydroquinate synthase